MERKIQAVYLLGGQPTGEYQESAMSGGGKTTVTSIVTDLIFNRLGAKVEIKTEAHYVEAMDGNLQSVSTDSSSSQQVTHMSVTVGSGTLDITTTTGGKSYQTRTQFTGVLLGPEGGRARILSQLRNPGDSTSYQTFSPELGTVATITATLVERERVEIDQHSFTALKVEESLSSMPGKVTIWLDQDGWMLRQSTPSPFGDIEAVRTELPTVPTIVAGASLPEESFSKSIVKANVRLPEERLIDSATLKIIHHRPELGWPDLETDNQRVLEKTPGYVVLKVTRVQPKESSAAAASDPSLAPYLAANALLQSDDSNIESIAQSAVGDEYDPWREARDLQKWTNQNMQFDLGIAIAPASEVARNRRGTCFGYAVMLGSLTRAAHIPSRLRMGYVYAGGMWGGHAWVDVWIGGRWIPLDGALYTPGAADAARFSFFTSSLEQGTLAGMGSLAQLFGNVDIQILDYSVEGHTVTVPQNATPYRITQDRYDNPWLGVSIVKPASFRFTDVNLTWPQETLLAMEGPSGQHLSVEDLSESLPSAPFDDRKYFAGKGVTGTRIEKVLGSHKATLISSGDQAGAIIEEGGNVWVFTAKGPKAEELLEQVVSRASFKY